MRQFALDNFADPANEFASAMLRAAGPDFPWVHRDPVKPRERLPQEIRSTRQIPIIIDRDKLFMATVREADRGRATLIIARLVRLKIWKAIKAVLGELNPHNCAISFVRVSPFFDQSFICGGTGMIVSTLIIETIDA